MSWKERFAGLNLVENPCHRMHGRGDVGGEQQRRDRDVLGLGQSGHAPVNPNIRGTTLGPRGPRRKESRFLQSMGNPLEFGNGGACESALQGHPKKKLEWPLARQASKQRRLDLWRAGREMRHGLGLSLGGQKLLRWGVGLSVDAGSGRNNGAQGSIEIVRIKSGPNPGAGAMPRDADRQSSSDRGLRTRRLRAERISVAVERTLVSCMLLEYRFGMCRGLWAHPVHERGRQTDPCASGKRPTASTRVLDSATRRRKSRSQKLDGPRPRVQNWRTHASSIWEKMVARTIDRWCEEG